MGDQAIDKSEEREVVKSRDNDRISPSKNDDIDALEGGIASIIDDVESSLESDATTVVERLEETKRKIDQHLDGCDTGSEYLFLRCKRLGMGLKRGLARTPGAVGTKEGITTVVSIFGLIGVLTRPHVQREIATAGRLLVDQQVSLWVPVALSTVFLVSLGTFGIVWHKLFDGKTGIDEIKDDITRAEDEVRTIQDEFKAAIARLSDFIQHLRERIRTLQAEQEASARDFYRGLATMIVMDEKGVGLDTDHVITHADCKIMYEAGGDVIYEETFQGKYLGDPGEESEYFKLRFTSEAEEVFEQDRFDAKMGFKNGTSHRKWVSIPDVDHEEIRVGLDDHEIGSDYLVKIPFVNPQQKSTPLSRGNEFCLRYRAPVSEAPRSGSDFLWIPQHHFIRGTSELDVHIALSEEDYDTESITVEGAKVEINTDVLLGQNANELINPDEIDLLSVGDGLTQGSIRKGEFAYSDDEKGTALYIFQIDL